MGPPTGAGGFVHDGDIPDPVPDHGERLLLQDGDDQFPPLAGLEHLTGLWIDDLGKGKVAPDVDTLLL